MGSVQQCTLVARCDVQRVLQQRIDIGSLTFLLQSVAATFFRFVLRMSVRGLGFLIGSLQSMQYSMMETIYVHVGPVLMFAMVLVSHDACVREKGLTRITAPTTSSSHDIQNCVIYSTLATRIVSIWPQLQDKHRPCAMLVLLWISLQCVFDRYLAMYSNWMLFTDDIIHFTLLGLDDSWFVHM